MIENPPTEFGMKCEQWFGAPYVKLYDPERKTWSPMTAHAPYLRAKAAWLLRAAEWIEGHAAVKSATAAKGGE